MSQISAITNDPCVVLILWHEVDGLKD